ncbi:4'-phosphopantetheinyl transferase superfamily protein [Bacteroides sp. 224]|uniref:4'-phosphopantetheinyl transferase family protein n=1 Tax=Bacteroides sp. 224 TaxID=2302936 RepID=UPI0013D64CED|nr:4'-phosphopantetheinyl transferase superfamily protein [Bacteroides sp. 224]NDV64598.1 siderophore biosynthesis protein [Bacteroides sp. 224]
MPLFKQYNQYHCRWAIWKQEESIDQLLMKLPVMGRAEYLKGMEAFTSESRRLEWLAIRVLLFELLGEMKKVLYEPSGKPYLADASAHISISHTKGYVAVIVSRRHEVGIDIEQYRDRVLKVAHKFVREDEKAHINPEKEILSLLLIWSAKEVMFKCMNESEVDFRAHLMVELPADSKPFMNCREYRTSLRKRFLIYYLTHPDFVMTWTIEEPEL